MKARLAAVVLVVAAGACFSPVDTADGGSGGGASGAGGGTTSGGSAGTGGGSTAGGTTSGGSAAGGSAAGGSVAGGATAGGSTSGGSTAGGSSTVGGGSAGGRSTAGGSSTVGGGSAGGSSAAGGSAGGAARTCTDVMNDYGQALTQARRCAPLLPVVQCLGRRALVLGCPQCTTAVETVGTLDALTAEFNRLGCVGGSCPFVCTNPPNSACVPDSAGTSGSCEDRP